MPAIRSVLLVAYGALLANEMGEKLCHHLHVDIIVAFSHTPLAKHSAIIFILSLSLSLSPSSQQKSEDMEEFRKRSATVSKGTPIDMLRESPTGKRSDTANSK